MKRLVLVLMVVAVFAANASAAISINPSTGEINNTRWEGNETSNSKILAAVLAITAPSTELYKSEVGIDSKPLASSYRTVFGTDPNDPQEATITWEGSGVVGATAYLLVKGGNGGNRINQPAWYLFDLTALKWDGSDALKLKEFWPKQGAIGHVSLFGQPGQLPDVSLFGESIHAPEPASLAIWALIAAGGAAAAARKRRGRWSKADREAVLEIIQKN